MGGSQLENRLIRLDDEQTTIVTNTSDRLAFWVELDVVDPRLQINVETDCLERQLFAPNGRLGLFVNALQPGGEDPDMTVCGPGSQQDAVLVPVQGQDGGLEGFLDMLGDPPVVFFFVVADRNDPGGRPDRKLQPVWRPLDTRGSPVDSQKDQRLLVLAVGLFGPHKRVSVLRTRDNEPGHRNVHGGDGLVVVRQRGHQLRRLQRHVVDQRVVGMRNDKMRLVRRETMRVHRLLGQLERQWHLGSSGFSTESGC